MRSFTPERVRFLEAQSVSQSVSAAAKEAARRRIQESYSIRCFGGCGSIRPCIRLKVYEPDWMSMNLFALTDQGLVRITIHGERAAVRPLKADDRLQCLARDPRNEGMVYVGSRGGGVWRSVDCGVTWSDTLLPEAHVFSLAVSPADGSVYAGTEPSRLFKSSDGGMSWRELEGLQDIPSRPTWSFPPRPWTSHVRAIAPHPEDADVLLVGIELGGLMRSEDGGETWQDHRPGAQKDVHSLAWHPRAVNRAYEAGGGGAAWSNDGGHTWEPVDAGRDRHYTWALALDPEDPDVWYVSAAESPRTAHSGEDAQAYVYRWRGSGPWQALSGGLPAPLRSMPYTLLHTGRRLFAGLKSGQLYASNDDGDTWIEIDVDGTSLKNLNALVL